jgi:purine-nucleoside phosphorylase
LNERVRGVAAALGIHLVPGKHWTTDAIHRTTFTKVRRYRERGVNSIDMELAALAGVAHYRGCELSALLVVTDVASRTHTWDGTASSRFRAGIEAAAKVAAALFV